jgi:hypothetical protein
MHALLEAIDRALGVDQPGPPSHVTNTPGYTPPLSSEEDAATFRGDVRLVKNALLLCFTNRFPGIPFYFDSKNVMRASNKRILQVLYLDPLRPVRYIHIRKFVRESADIPALVRERIAPLPAPFMIITIVGDSNTFWTEQGFVDISINPPAYATKQRLRPQTRTDALALIQHALML